MKTTLTLIITLLFQFTYSQVDYGTPTNEPLPEKLQNLRPIIEVHHFPKEVHPIKIKNEYYWKHNTAILCLESDIIIIEYGAYIFYNDTWNLRKSYPLKELDSSFGTKNQLVLQAQPYTYTNNWRSGTQLFGGWALWYFIGKTSKGETVCGFEKINTTDKLLN